MTEMYDAYGARTATGAQPDPWGYMGEAGYYNDGDKSLLLCTHRFYDPATGRFVTRDPISYRGGVNLYGYTRNNSIEWDDPSGLYIDIGITLGGVIGVAGGVQIDPTNSTISLYGGGYIGLGPPIGISIQGSPGSPTPGGFVGLFGGAGLGVAGGYSGLGTKNAGPSASGGLTTPGVGVEGGYVWPASCYGGSPGLPGGPPLPTDPISSPVGPGMPGYGGPEPGDPGSEIPM